MFLQLSLEHFLKYRICSKHFLNCMNDTTNCTFVKLKLNQRPAAVLVNFLIHCPLLSNSVSLWEWNTWALHNATNPWPEAWKKSFEEQMNLFEGGMIFLAPVYIFHCATLKGAHSLDHRWGQFKSPYSGVSLVQPNMEELVSRLVVGTARCSKRTRLLSKIHPSIHPTYSFWTLWTL